VDGRLRLWVDCGNKQNTTNKKILETITHLFGIPSDVLRLCPALSVWVQQIRGMEDAEICRSFHRDWSCRSSRICNVCCGLDIVHIHRSVRLLQAASMCGFCKNKGVVKKKPRWYRGQYLVLGTVQLRTVDFFSWNTKHNKENEVH